MYDLLIFNGQSNMQGQTEALLAAPPVKNAFEYRLIGDELISLCVPAGENILINGERGYDCADEYAVPQWVKDHALGASYHGNTNMVCEFVRTYIKETGHGVVAVHAAKGSTKIADWQKGGVCYDYLVKKTKAAIAKAGENNINKRYLIFLQGESDALNNTAKEEYKTLLKNYCQSLKKDIFIDKFCIIKVGFFAKFFNTEGDEAVIQAQEEICSDNDFLMLTEITHILSQKREYMNPYFVGHYSAKTQMLIGHRAGQRLGVYASDRPLKVE